MKTRRDSFMGASALQIALRLALVSLSVSLFTGAFAAASLGKSESTVRRFAKLTPVAPQPSQPRELSLTDRLDYQRKVEEVYWRHRIWPKEKPQPSFDAVVSQSRIKEKVEEYLRNAQALEEFGQEPVRAEQLQSEMDRMARDTQQPEVLRELFAALGNDPFIIAECLAKPALSERLLTNLDVHDQPVHRERKPLAALPVTTAALAGEYTLPRISASGPIENTTSMCVNNTWTSTSLVNPPSGRAEHTAVWTGSEMIVWGGQGNGGFQNTGRRYVPATDTWTATSTVNAPLARAHHNAVWTGSEMIVWGGHLNGSFTFTATGGRYNPVTDAWIATNNVGAPSQRSYATAVWTGSEMIVWGGYNTGFVYANTGGRYNPMTDSWLATSNVNVPVARVQHTAVWTGNEMIIWGGFSSVAVGNVGWKYNPGTDSWIATSAVNAPSSRFNHTAVYLGGEMIVWGGGSNTGGRYNPSTDSWTATSTTNAPPALFYNTAVATETEMIVWGDSSTTTGGRYNPTTDSWTPTSTANVPSRRILHSAVWTGNEMIVWGGVLPTPTSAPNPPAKSVAVDPEGSFGFLTTGGRYCAQAPIASPTPTATPTIIPSPTPTVTPSATPSPQATGTPVDCGGIGRISGSVSNCSAPFPTATPPANPTPPPPVPVPDVLVTASSFGSNYSTSTDSLGNYGLSVPAGFNTTYTVNPSRGPLAPGSGSINTTDVLAVQRHFLAMAIIPPGCRLNAADVVIDGSVNTTDVIAIQRFFLAFTNGIGSAGQYKFLPASRTAVVFDCSVSGGNVFSMYVVGDVAVPFANRGDDDPPDALSRQDLGEFTKPLLSLFDTRRGRRPKR